MAIFHFKHTKQCLLESFCDTISGMCDMMEGRDGMVVTEGQTDVKFEMIM